MSTTKNLPKKTTVKVDRDIHTQLRIKAAKEGKRVEEVVDEILKKGLEAIEK